MDPQESDDDFRYLNGRCKMLRQQHIRFSRAALKSDSEKVEGNLETYAPMEELVYSLDLGSRLRRPGSNPGWGT